MASTKISALTTDSTPDRTADYLATYDASAAGNKKITVENAGGYCLPLLYSNTFNPTDATTYFLTGSGTAAATAANYKMRIPRAGVIRRVYIDGNCTTGTSETSTISIRLNDTTDTTIVSTLALNASPFAFSNTSMSISVSAGDWISLKWVTANWVTNPTNVVIWGLVWIA